MSGLTRYDAAAAAAAVVEGIDCAGNSCEQPAAAPSSAVVEHRAASEASVAPSVVAAPSAFVIVADVAVAVESLVLAPERDASLQTMPAEVAFHLEMSAEREPSAPATAEETVVAVVANVVVVVVVAAATVAAVVAQCALVDSVASAVLSAALFGSWRETAPSVPRSLSVTLTSVDLSK